MQSNFAHCPIVPSSIARRVPQTHGEVLHVLHTHCGSSSWFSFWCEEARRVPQTHGVVLHVLQIHSGSSRSSGFRGPQWQREVQYPQYESALANSLLLLLQP